MLVYFIDKLIFVFVTYLNFFSRIKSIRPLRLFINKQKRKGNLVCTETIIKVSYKLLNFLFYL